MIKYEELLKPLTAEKKIHVDEKGISNLTLNFQEAKSRTTFALYEIENKLFVSWSYNSKGIGQRGKEWCFKQDSCQQKMYLQIRQDIETCLRSISI